MVVAARGHFVLPRLGVETWLVEFILRSVLPGYPLTMWWAWAALLATIVAVSSQPSGAPSTITVQFVIRDFVGQCTDCGISGDVRNKTTHRDFEANIANDYGIIDDTLGPDRVRDLSAS